MRQKYLTSSCKCLNICFCIIIFFIVNNDSPFQAEGLVQDIFLLSPVADNQKEFNFNGKIHAL